MYRNDRRAHPASCDALSCPGSSRAPGIDSSDFQNGANLSLPVRGPGRFPCRRSIGRCSSLDCRRLRRRFADRLSDDALPLRLATSFSFSEHARFAACGAIGLLYLRHAFSRADIDRFARTIPPLHDWPYGEPIFLPGAHFICLQVRRFDRGRALAVGRRMPIYSDYSPVASIRSNAVDGVYLRPDDKQLVDDLSQFAAAHIRPQEGLLIAPSAPGLYAILDRVSPLWRFIFSFLLPSGNRGEWFAP